MYETKSNALKRVCGQAELLTFVRQDKAFLRLILLVGRMGTAGSNLALMGGHFTQSDHLAEGAARVEDG